MTQEDGSGPEGPHFEAEALSGPEGPHVAVGPEGPHPKVKVGPEGPHAHIAKIGDPPAEKTMTTTAGQAGESETAETE